MWAEFVSTLDNSSREASFLIFELGCSKLDLMSVSLMQDEFFFLCLEKIEACLLVEQ